MYKSLTKIVANIFLSNDLAFLNQEFNLNLFPHPSWSRGTVARSACFIFRATATALWIIFQLYPEHLKWEQVFQLLKQPIPSHQVLFPMLLFSYWWDTLPFPAWPLHILHPEAAIVCQWKYVLWVIKLIFNCVVCLWKCKIYITITNFPWNYLHFFRQI